MTFLGQ